MKCDETRPACLRCKLGSRFCDGYEFVPAPKAPRKKLLPKNKIVSKQMTVLPDVKKIILPSELNNGPPALDQDEYAYFDIFRKKTCRTLSGYYECEVWNRLILQICHDEGYARHAAIAIGALDIASSRPSLLHSSVSSEKDIAKQHYRFALQQYSKALGAMRDFANQDAKTRVRNTIISALLTACFESYLGNEEQALQQAQAGIDVILQSDWNYFTSSRGEFQCQGSFFDSELLDTFLRLDSQVITLKHVSTSSRWGSQAKSMNLPLIPKVFATTKQARYFLSTIGNRRLQWNSKGQPIKSPTTRVSSVDIKGQNLSAENGGAENNDVECADTELGKALEQWSEAFGPLFERSRSSPKESKTYLGANLLKIKYNNFKISESTATIDDETSDILLEIYEESVELAVDLLSVYNKHHQSGAHLFMFDDGLISCLLCIGLGCQDGALRWKVIDLLLRYPRREGLWDSAMAAAVIKWFMDEEERIAVGSYIPAGCKLKLVKMQSFLSQRRVLIRYSRIKGFEAGSQQREVMLSW